MGEIKVGGRGVRTSLFVFCSFAVAYNVSVAFHEAGHALAVLLDGGSIQEYYLNPFSWSWNLGRDVSNVLFTASGGVTFGLALALLPLALFRWVSGAVGRAFLLILGGTSLLVNGVYLVVGVVTGIGDGGELMRLGVSPVWVGVSGGCFLLVGLGLWTGAQPWLGLGPQNSLPGRGGVLLMGVAPYLALILTYNAFLNPQGIPEWASFSGAGLLAVVLFAGGGHLWARGRIPLLRHPVATGVTPSWRAVAWAGMAALVIVVGELAFFGIKTAPF